MSENPRLVNVLFKLIREKKSTKNGRKVVKISRDKVLVISDYDKNAPNPNSNTRDVET